MIIDPVSDTLTRIRNSLSLKYKKVIVNYSTFIKNLLKLLYYVGYINGFVINYSEKCFLKSITILLKYDILGESVIHGLKRISRPGLRVYSNIKNIPIVYNGIGTAIISTSKGLVTSYRAKKMNIGGEIICYVW